MRQDFFLETISKSQIAAEGKARADGKAQHTREYVSIFRGPQHRHRALDGVLKWLLRSIMMKELPDMLLKLFLAFTLIPFFEIYVLIKIGYYLGAFNTIVVVIVTGLLGAYLAKMQGIRAMMRVRESMNRGALPAEEMLDALLIFVAGLVLLTPGFITDLAGIGMLVPNTRTFFKRWLRRKFDQWIAENRADVIIF